MHRLGGRSSELWRKSKHFLEENNISEIFRQTEKIRAQLRAQKVLFIRRRCCVRRTLLGFFQL